MDLVTAFTTLVGLLSIFKQEQTADCQLDHRKFMEWLEDHRHEELKDLIANTHHLSHEVDVLLREDQQKILDELKTVGSILGTIFSRLEGFAGIVKAIAPDLKLSDQATTILGLLIRTNSQRMCVLHRPEGFRLALFPESGDGSLYPISSPRFVEDDLQALLRLGLIFRNTEQDYGGAPIYHPTRAGLQYLQAIGQTTV